MCESAPGTGLFSSHLLALLSGSARPRPFSSLPPAHALLCPSFMHHHPERGKHTIQLKTESRLSERTQSCLVGRGSVKEWRGAGSQPLCRLPGLCGRLPCLLPLCQLHCSLKTGFAGTVCMWHKWLSSPAPQSP